MGAMIPETKQRHRRLAAKRLAVLMDEASKGWTAARAPNGRPDPSTSGIGGYDLDLEAKTIEREICLTPRIMTRTWGRLSTEQLLEAIQRRDRYGQAKAA